MDSKTQDSDYTDFDNNFDLAQSNPDRIIRIYQPPQCLRIQGFILTWYRPLIVKGQWKIPMIYFLSRKTGFILVVDIVTIVTIEFKISDCSGPSRIRNFSKGRPTWWYSLRKQYFISLSLWTLINYTFFQKSYSIPALSVGA